MSHSEISRDFKKTSQSAARPSAFEGVAPPGSAVCAPLISGSGGGAVRSMEHGARARDGGEDRAQGGTAQGEPPKAWRGVRGWGLWLPRPDAPEALLAHGPQAQKELTMWIRHNCPSAEFLSHRLDTAGELLSASNLFAALTYCQRERVQAADARLGHLCDALGHVLGAAPWACNSDKGGRNLAMAASALAKLQPAGAPALLARIAAVVTAPWHLPRLNAQELSTLSWAFTKLAPAAGSTAHLLHSLAPCMLRGLPQFRPIDLCNCALAYAKADTFSRHPDLFHAVCAAAATPQGFNPQDFANISWAIATAASAPPWLTDGDYTGGRAFDWDQVGGDAVDVGRGAAPGERQGKGNQLDLSCALGFFRAAAAELAHETPWDGGRGALPLRAFRAEELSICAWAFGKACLDRTASSQAVLAVAREVLEDAKGAHPRAWASQEICNLATGFAAGCELAKVWNHEALVVSLFGFLGGRARGHLRNFNCQSLSNLAHAFAKVGVATRLFHDEHAVGEVLRRPLHPSEVVVVAYSFAKLRVPLPGSMLKILQEQGARLDGRDLCTVIWALACADEGPRCRVREEAHGSLWRLAGARPLESYDRPSRSMLFHAWLLDSVERRLLAMPSPAWIDAMRHAFRDGHSAGTSRQQEDVSKVRATCA
ncbi:hypothetical protein CYMTET_2937 [Cymbomonas tetramitiformis]|uniref:Uncharacterized protein n=1 Tax=Cymbomonas tetramitiformis TaxID=36881 RepID=A0AAE0LLL7_9CHLO|nr:hypothetical protein CYMTET_2937 [Cymbomonas tetramitiformis]